MMKSIWNWILDLSLTKKLLLLFMLAFIVRLIGVNYGYWFGDERINDAAKVLAGQLVPGQHFYPPLLNYITAVFFAALYVIGRLFVFWYDIGEFRAQYFSDPTPFYITARIAICLMSASVAPIFYLIARELKFSKSHAILVGLFGVFIPGMVLLSHISKSDVPMATCVALVFYMGLRKMNNPDSFWVNVFFALSISLAMSFKHSYIFILLPFFIGFCILFYLQNKNFIQLLKSCVIIGIVSLSTWAVFNIGILLDFANFLDYQKIQGVMSIREDKNIIDGATKWWSIMANLGLGINPIVLILSLISPVFIFNKTLFPENRGMLFVFWLSIIIGTLIIMYISGSRQQSGLWVPYMVAMQLLAILGLCSLIRSKINTSFRLMGILGSGIASILSVIGCLIVMQQAIAKPIVFNVESFLNEYYPKETKILSGFTMKSPQTLAMSLMEDVRNQRIADKYEIELPPRAEENILKADPPGAINYHNMPVVFHGLEHASDEDLKGVIKPHSWPFQKEEWKLDYWLDKDFSVFVLMDHEYTLTISKVDIIKNLHKEIKDRCDLARHFDPTKPLFVEFSATIYNCKR